MKGVELSLITKKPLEMNGKGLGDIRIQTKTGQMKSFFWPILDTSFSAAVRPGSPWGLQLEQSPGVVVQEAQCFVFYALGAICFPFEGTVGTFLAPCQRVENRQYIGSINLCSCSGGSSLGRLAVLQVISSAGVFNAPSTASS